MSNFERDGVVSIWVVRKKVGPADAEKDVLRDLCGVDGYYDLDNQEGAISDKPQNLATLIGQLSYSDSFINDAVQAAEAMGIKEAFGVLVQFDFAYDLSEVTRPIAKDPVFIGYFGWHD